MPFFVARKSTARQNSDRVAQNDKGEHTLAIIAWLPVVVFLSLTIKAGNLVIP
jgi:hypothetical protein